MMKPLSASRSATGLAMSVTRCLLPRTASRLWRLLKRRNQDIVITDLVMPGMDGIELLKKAKEISPNIEVIIITAYGSVPTAITAMRDGAYDYIEKPFRPEKAEILIDKLVEHQHLVEENIACSRTGGTLPV